MISKHLKQKLIKFLRKTKTKEQKKSLAFSVVLGQLESKNNNDIPTIGHWRRYWIIF